MGTIIARGGGFDADSEQIWAFVQFVKRCTGKENPNFLLVPTTAFDQVNKGTLNCYHKLGCSVDTLLLTADYMTPEIISRKLETADIIEVPGGNLKFTKEVWEKTGAEELIKKAYLRGAVLTGSSAGAMVWFSRGYDNCGLYDSQMFTPGIGLIPYAVCPHYDEVFWKSFDVRVHETGLSGVALENGAAYCVMSDGSTQILRASGGKKAWFFDAENGYEKREL
ncbi:MAG: Type 1 glutamine amidotransferase-like domain-containing protein [Clostridia bacterium]|nr:Type 1 glutamine amidotransferase-like domain-containing protein [Clostridia bacterium]